MLMTSAMSRDWKMTVLCGFTLLVVMFGHEVLNLYVWIGLLVILTVMVIFRDIGPPTDQPR